MKTDADTALDEAKSHVVEAIRALGKIEQEEVYGWDGFTPEYAEKIDEALAALRRIRRDLR